MALQLRHGLPQFSFVRLLPGRGARIVWSWLPSFCGSCSVTATSPSSVDQPLQDAPADLRVRVFAAAEEDRRLHLVAFAEEALDVLLLELVVVLVDLRPELDFLDLDDLLVLLRRPRALLLLVLVLAEVHDPADRRHGRRRNLHQVQSLASRERERLRRRHDAELLAVVVDDANFAHPDSFVDPNTVVAAWASIESDNYLLQTIQDFERRPANWHPATARRSRRRGRLALRRASISAFASAMNASIDRAPRSPPVRLRTATVPSASFPVPDHQHVGDLLELSLPNLITNLLLAPVELDPEAGGRQLGPDLLGVGDVPIDDRQDDGLDRRQPEREGARRSARSAGR